MEMDLPFIFVETISFPMMSEPGSPLAPEVLDYVQFFEAGRSEACVLAPMLVATWRVYIPKLSSKRRDLAMRRARLVVG